MHSFQLCKNEYHIAFGRLVEHGHFADLFIAMEEGGLMSFMLKPDSIQERHVCFHLFENARITSMAMSQDQMTLLIGCGQMCYMLDTLTFILMDIKDWRLSDVGYSVGDENHLALLYHQQAETALHVYDGGDFRELLQAVLPGHACLVKHQESGVRLAVVEYGSSKSELKLFSVQCSNSFRQLIRLVDEGLVEEGLLHCRENDIHPDVFFVDL